MRTITISMSEKKLKKIVEGLLGFSEQLTINADAEWAKELDELADALDKEIEKFCESSNDEESE